MGEERQILVRYCPLPLPYYSCIHLVAQLWNCKHDSTVEQLGPWTIHRWNLVNILNSHEILI